jgi:hypothetical protein
MRNSLKAFITLFFSLLFFNIFSIPTFASYPKGVLDAVDCTSFRGWACDPDNYAQAIDVLFYKDGTASTARLIGSTTANLPREAAVGDQCGGYTSHGFVFSTPDSIADGKTHKIYAYANNIPSGTDHQLTGSYQTLSPCINHRMEVWVKFPNTQTLKVNECSSILNDFQCSINYYDCPQLGTYYGKALTYQDTTLLSQNPEDWKYLYDHVSVACTADNAKDSNITNGIDSNYCTWNIESYNPPITNSPCTRHSGVQSITGQNNPTFWEGHTCGYPGSSDLWGEKKVYADDINKLDIQARAYVDDESWVWINGKEVTDLHRGCCGFTNWVDVKSYFTNGWNTIKFKTSDYCSGGRYFNLEWDIKIRDTPEFVDGAGNPFNITGYKEYLNVFWYAKYPSDSQRQLAVNCTFYGKTTQLCIPYPYYQPPGKGSCSVANPDYDYTRPNNITCRTYDPNNATLGYNEYW